MVQTEQNRNKLLLVDGSNLLFQMFFGMPQRIVNKDGTPIQGVLGFVGALLKIIRMIAPTHVVVLFDGEHANERTQLLDEYKANRVDYSAVAAEDNPFSQLEHVYAALDYLGIKHAETVSCETDDWIAAYAKKYADDCEVVISSFDSDFFQLISASVSVLRYRGKSSTLCTPQFVRDKLGIDPCQYADFKAMVGDTADNVRGVPKIGPKTAADLLNRFGTLEAIISNATAIEKQSVRDSIVANVQLLQTNLKIIKLDGCYDLPFTIDKLSYALPAVTTRQVLASIGL